MQHVCHGQWARLHVCMGAVSTDDHHDPLRQPLQLCGQGGAQCQLLRDHGHGLGHPPGGLGQDEEAGHGTRLGRDEADGDRLPPAQGEP